MAQAVPDGRCCGLSEGGGRAVAAPSEPPCAVAATLRGVVNNTLAICFLDTGLANTFVTRWRLLRRRDGRWQIPAARPRRRSSHQSMASRRRAQVPMPPAGGSRCGCAPGGGGPGLADHQADLAARPLPPYRCFRLPRIAADDPDTGIVRQLAIAELALGDPLEPGAVGMVSLDATRRGRGAIEKVAKDLPRHPHHPPVLADRDTKPALMPGMTYSSSVPTTTA